MDYLSERSNVNTILHMFMQIERVIHGHITVDDIAVTDGTQHKTLATFH